MDIIFQEDGKWYFWDETWSNKYGPYDTKEACEKALDEYTIVCLGPQ